jgi:hypothetical protein
METGGESCSRFGINDLQGWIGGKSTQIRAQRIEGITLDRLMSGQYC